MSMIMTTILFAVTVPTVSVEKVQTVYKLVQISKQLFLILKQDHKSERRCSILAVLAR
jgi:hypothetical protein